MNFETSDEFNVWSEKKEIMPNITVTRISDGLDFGEGAISLEDRLDEQDHDHQIDRQTILKVESAIESDNILVAIDIDDDQQPIEDDGCGDGRGVKRLFAGFKELKRSLNRAKAFGGGLMMSVASKIGLGGAADKMLNEVFSEEINSLDELGIEFGAHTDDHASGENGGCGAIDKAPVIIANAVKYQNAIVATIKQLTQGGHDQSALDAVFANFSAYADQVQNDQTYSGRKVVEKIMENHKVVKELEGPHLETHIVINTFRGYTVNQAYIREVSGSKAQVFAVDAWHLQNLANKRYKDPADQERAYLSMLVYTLATAATLTKGDLPVYVVSSN